jgi:hypothetical protein
LNRSRAEAIVEFLGFSPNSETREAFEVFTAADWENVLRWMDDAGLTFYFLQKIRTTNVASKLPAWVRSRIETNLAANQERTAALANKFDCLNRSFGEAGIRYAVLKGFSLVPDFCPRASLRHQSDFDYLVDEKSLNAARRIVVEAGYVAKDSRSNQESIFISPGTELPSRGGRQYSAQAPHAVELHLDVWDGDFHQLPGIPKMFSVERTISHQWNGLIFSALDDRDAFLLQVLHASHHLFTQWIRMSCLFEIAYFLKNRSTDVELWEGVHERVGKNLVLREFIVVVTELAAKLFDAPIPAAVQIWGEEIRSGPRVWIENYSRHWAFSDVPVYQFNLFPTSKLVLFLQQQYRDKKQDAGSTVDRVSPSRFARLTTAIRKNPRLIVSANWWKRQLLVRRLIFNALAMLRYLCEVPRWLWLTRVRMRSASFEV